MEDAKIVGTAGCECVAQTGFAPSGAEEPMRTALVVDDSMLIRHTVCRFLEEQGFDVEAVTNGLEALDVLARCTPDIIVTDLSMPKMTGDELIDEIKKRPELSQTPIVILSAKATAAALAKAADHRANFVVYKDIDIDEQLLKALNSIFASH